MPLTQNHREARTGPKLELRIVVQLCADQQTFRPTKKKADPSNTLELRFKKFKSNFKQCLNRIMVDARAKHFRIVKAWPDQVFPPYVLRLKELPNRKDMPLTEKTVQQALLNRIVYVSGEMISNPVPGWFRCNVEELTMIREGVDVSVSHLKRPPVPAEIPVE